LNALTFRLIDSVILV